MSPFESDGERRLPADQDASQANDVTHVCRTINRVARRHMRSSPIAVVLLLRDTAPVIKPYFNTQVAGHIKIDVSQCSGDIRTYVRTQKIASAMILTSYIHCTARAFIAILLLYYCAVLLYCTVGHHLVRRKTRRFQTTSAWIS